MSLDMYGEEMPKVENMMLYTGFEVDEVYPLKSLIFVAVSVCYSCVGLESEDECNSQPLQTCSPLQVSVVSVLPASNNACRGHFFLVCLSSHVSGSVHHSVTHLSCSL